MQIIFNNKHLHMSQLQTNATENEQNLPSQQEYDSSFQNTSVISLDGSHTQQRIQRVQNQMILAEHQFSSALAQIKLQTPQETPNNRQGYFTLLKNEAVFTQSASQSFKEILNQFMNDDLCDQHSFWNKQFITKVEFVLEHWNMFKVEYMEMFTDFIKIADRKIHNMEIYEKFCPGARNLIAKMKKTIQYKITKNQQKLLLKECKEDNIFFTYLKQQQDKARKVGTYFIKLPDQKRVPIGTYIVQQNLYKNKQQTWKELFFVGAAINRYNVDIAEEEDTKNQCKRVYKFADLLLQKNELTQPSKKICCSKFFYANFNICPLQNGNLICRPKNNLLRSRVNTIYANSKRVVQKQEFQRYQQEMSQLMLDIIGLLNRGGGVVLLFAKKIYLQTWVQGDSILQAKKELYVKLIREALEGIQPKVQMDKEIKVTFVPVVRNPYEYDYNTTVKDESDKINNRNYIPGLYCPRINVVPSQSQQMYFYADKQKPISAVFQNGNLKVLEGEEMEQQKKRKFEYFSVNAPQADQDEQMRELLSKDYLYMQRHKCEQPYKGSPIYQVQQKKQVKPLKDFKYMSMLVAHKSNHRDIQQKLVNRGIQCFISNVFVNLNLKSSFNSAPIYHNIRFDQLLSQISYNREFQYNKRYILLISVTSYIKLERIKQYPKSDLQAHLEAINQTFPGVSQSLELYSFTTEDGLFQQYIKATMRESTLLVYYRLHHAGQKSILKNPKSLQKIPQPQKSQRWKLIYQVTNTH